MPHSVLTGIIMLENPNVMLLQYNRLDNSVTSEECQGRDGTLSIERRVAYSWLSCRKLLCQSVHSCAFLSKRPNFRLQRNLLHRDEVVRKRSSRGVVLRRLPDLGRSATFPVCWNLFSSRLIVALEMPNNVSCRHAIGKHTDGSLMLLKRHSRHSRPTSHHWFSKIFFPQFLC